MEKKVAPGSGGGLITKTDAELTSEQLGLKNRAHMKIFWEVHIFYSFQLLAFQVLREFRSHHLSFVANNFSSFLVSFSSRDAC